MTDRTAARVAAGAVLAAVALAACGGDSPKPAAGTAPGSTTAPSGTASHVPGHSGAPGSGSSVAPSHGTGGNGATTAPGTGTGGNGTGSGGNGATTAPGATPTGPSPNPSKTQIVLDAKLSKECVRPGESITLSMKARPGMNVIYDTSYPDGKDGSTHGGRDYKGRTDATGAYSSTWTVSLAASPGEAVVVLAAVDDIGTGHNRLPFQIKTVC